MAKYKPLAVMAADTEDLRTVSALLQDAIAKVGEMAYLPKERRFAFVANRFIHETGKPGLFNPAQRVRAGVHFDDVIGVRARAVRMDASEALVDILSADYEGTEDGGVITLNLAGGGAIALDVEAINATVEDISRPWRASRKPDHGEG